MYYIHVCCVQRNRKQKDKFMAMHPYVEPAALLYSRRTIKPYIAHANTHLHTCMQIDTDSLWFVKVCTKMHSTTVCVLEKS